MFKNALIYRINPDWDRPAAEAVNDRLDGMRFAPCAPTAQLAIGFAEPRGEEHGLLLEPVGGQWIMRVLIEKKTVPADVIKRRVKELADKIEADTGRRPKGKKAKELKEEALQELLPRAFPKRSSTAVWIDPAARLVLLDASSTSTADAVVSLLIEAMGGGISLNLLQTQLSPSTAMAQWLKEREGGPSGFTVDRECELKCPDGEQSAVRYSRHTLDIDEVVTHLQQGKIPTKLAMTWGSRVSFVLTDRLTLKGIKLLDLALEGQPDGTQATDFDASVAIFTGEMSQLVPELAEALDGELVA